MTKKTRTSTKKNSPDAQQEAMRIINDATRVYSKTISTIDNQISRIEVALGKIRDACSNENIPVPPAMAGYINDINKFKLFQGRLHRHMNGINDPNIAVDKKIAMIATLIELSDQIPQTSVD